jgi:hypothetical protein
MIRTVASACVAISALSLAGCEQQSHGQPRSVARVESLEGKIGKSCKVFFRYDILGVQRDNPFDIDAGNINGASTTVSGTLIGADGEWIILKQGDGPETWVPRGNILFLRF